MDGPKIFILSVVCRTEEDKYNIAYMWNPKKIMLQMNLFKKKNSHRHRQTYGYQGGNEE